MSSSKPDLEFIINHVILPPKLPQRADEDSYDLEQSLLALVENAVNEFSGLQEEETGCIWSEMTKLLTEYRLAHEKWMSEDQILSSLRALDTRGVCLKSSCLKSLTLLS